MNEFLTIPEYFNGKTIFLTGGSGFIGKCLIEKILRSCPDINTIYVLMRPKKGQSIEERVRAITDLPLFDRLKNENRESLKKIKLIQGDVSHLELGLNEEDRALLIQQVNLIIHAAASVRFDDPLKEAILMNTRGTRELCELALKMKNLEVLVHISTTYCNTDRKVIDEKLYPPHADWRESIRLAEKVDTHTLNVLAPKYMGTLPNTYTFAKSLAEHVVYDLCNKKIPVVIFRPSIVISSFKEPFPGWIDNFNGPVGILLASGKGVLRSVFTEPDIVADYVPVDCIVKGLMITMWHKGVTTDPTEKYETSFYNGSKDNKYPVTMGEIVSIGREFCSTLPLNNVLWYPGGAVTPNPYYHYFKVIFYHLIPALIIDGLLKLTGNKPMLMKIQRKIYTANMALHYFITNEWQFINTKALDLESNLLPSDVENFAFNEKNMDIMDYFMKAGLGARRYLLHEDDSTLEQAKTHNRRMWILHVILTVTWYAFLLWLVFVKIDILSILHQKYTDCYIYLTTND